MDKCFIIQPFDGDVFDKRCTDIFEPAIKAAGLEPYRVDKDPLVNIPIDDIEKGIEDAKIIFAEITTDNPNVWYELGYAFALKKDVILVCEGSKRNGKFPFDIQHRQIIKYESTSMSDFDKLKLDIEKKLQALVSKQRNIENIIETPVEMSEGLKPHEITLMFTLMSQQLTDNELISAYSLKNDMEKAGFTEAAVGLAIRQLKRIGFISITTGEDYNGNSYTALKLTDKGDAWILDNQDKIQIRKEERVHTNITKEEDVSPDDIPF